MQSHLKGKLQVILIILEKYRLTSGRGPDLSLSIIAGDSLLIVPATLRSISLTTSIFPYWAATWRAVSPVWKRKSSVMRVLSSTWFYLWTFCAKSNDSMCNDKISVTDVIWNLTVQVTEEQKKIIKIAIKFGVRPQNVKVSYSTFIYKRFRYKHSAINGSFQSWKLRGLRLGVSIQIKSIKPKC